MRRKASPTAIGAFVVGAIVLAAVAVILLASGQFFRSTAEFIAYFRGSVNGLRIGAPVKFKGVEIGSVRDVRLPLGAMMEGMTPENIRIPVIIQLDAERMQERGGAGDLGDERLSELINQGLRAQLSVESLVTGLLYVALDMRPGTPLDLVKRPEVPYREIPTLPTALEEIQMRASRIIAEIEKADLARLIEDLKGTIAGVRELVTAPGLRNAVAHLDETVARADAALAAVEKTARDLDDDGRLGQSLRDTSAKAGAALEAARVTLESARGTVGPDSDLALQLRTTLAEVALAATAVRRLADVLERDPSAIVRGRGAPEDTR